MHRSQQIRTRISAIGIALLAATALTGVAMEHARAETTITIAYFDGALQPYGTFARGVRI